ncbi:thioesterase [Mycolicibacterium anyangense]|uniref:Thioesterase n=1 Tax=Mycolicibacterium anyangense TaxID=1431246 RepID=A0A6N4WA18_9MYCO|nr:alpha/beta fold hydrolase [Mycolicibacterium anyangense]BBZ76874.1 thioesterase [Mycolicibacterium anyangense]
MTAAPVPVRRVVPVDGIPMSGLLAEAAEPKAVIVALHGGASSAAYFDCPGHPELSLLRAAAATGFTALALDRPGYGTSASYADQMWDPARRVELVCAAIDVVLRQRSRGAGVFVMAHSNGCELALRIAVTDRASEVLGVELAGTGVRRHPAARSILEQAPSAHRPAGLRELIWAPSELYPDDVVNAVGVTGSPPQDAEVSANWAARDLPDLAARVHVPVRVTAAEHERFWDCSPESLAQITAMFGASPRVEINQQAGCGHNLSLGLAAAQYHSGVLAFVQQCIDAG